MKVFVYPNGRYSKGREYETTPQAAARRYAYDTDCGDCELVVAPSDDAARSTFDWKVDDDGAYIVFRVEPADIRETVSTRWFCHDTPDTACRGNANLIAKIRRRA